MMPTVTMNKALALSLIIPAYNEEQHLKACLDSVSAQTRLPDEVIVVDNNSTDKTAQIAKNYPFVRLISEKQQGIVYARNAGFNTARYPLLGRIDSDSILPRDWVEQIFKFYEQYDPKTVCITGGGKHYNVPLPRIGRWVFDLLAFRVNRVVLGHHFLFGSNMVIPKPVWSKIKSKVCLRTDIHEDIDIAIHVHEIGAKIVYESKFLVGIKLRRVFHDHDKLWGVLMLWPQSLKIHHHKLWVTGWLGAILLYALTPLLYPIEGLHLLRMRLFGRNN
jgi:glycosyltransferase involved in cell wall biosynthesis